jgi:hypothetical protein
METTNIVDFTRRDGITNAQTGLLRTGKETRCFRVVP